MFIKRGLVALAAVSCGIRLFGASLVIAEINYNPPGDSDYEFLELLNVGNTTFDLTGCRFSAGIDFIFGAKSLAAGGRLVVAKDLKSFSNRYPGIAAEGPFQKKLSNDGDTIVLVNPVGTELTRVKYEVTGSWPSRANGLGSTLEVVDPAGDLQDPDNWRSSSEYNGSPGRAGLGKLRKVVINEVLAHTDPPFEDAIEFKNLTDQPIDLGGYYLSNSLQNAKKVRLPKPWVIPAGGYRVIYENFFNSPVWESDAFTLNSAHGDDAVLMAADAAGNLTQWMDTVSFAASANGLSFGRYPDGTGPLIVLDRQTFGTDIAPTFPPQFLSEFVLGTGASNAAPRVGPVVFSKINYEPLPGHEEYLELKNISPLQVLLFDPDYPTNTWRMSEGIGFHFSPGAQLGPGEGCLLVRTNPIAFRSRYNIAADIQIFGPYTNSLSNSGERVQLFRPDSPQGPLRPDAGFVPYLLVDEVDYKPTAPWPLEAAGRGAYLERIQANRYGDDFANWRAGGVAIQDPISLEVSWSPAGTLRVVAKGLRRVPLRLMASPSLESPVWSTAGDLPTGDQPFSLDLVPTGGWNFFLLRRY